MQRQCLADNADAAGDNRGLIVTAPAAFRFTYEAMPEKHHEAAERLTGGPVDPGPDALPDALLTLMRDWAPRSTSRR